MDKRNISKDRLPTRYYSNKQEQQVAKDLNSKKVSNSGATTFNKGDVISDKFLIECKTVTKKQKSISIKEEWLLKNEEESFAMGRIYSALAINFEPGGHNYYLIDSDLFKILKDSLEGCE